MRGHRTKVPLRVEPICHLLFAKARVAGSSPAGCRAQLQGLLSKFKVRVHLVRFEA